MTRSSRSATPIGKIFALVLILAPLVGGALWFGSQRSSSARAADPEVGQRVMLAQKFVTSGEHQKALEIFRELDEKGQGYGEEGQIVRISALDGAGKHDDAAEAAKAFLKKYPESAGKEQAEYIVLNAALAKRDLGSDVELQKNVESFLAENPDHPSSVRLVAALAQQDLKAGNRDAAIARLEPLLKTSSDNPEVFAIADEIGKANLAALLSTTQQEGDVVYTVKKGDSINRIARANKVTDELLLKCNGITNPKNLRIGQTLRVPQTDFSLVVDVAANTLVLNNHGKFFRIYRVRTGRESGTTPTGEYRILNKKTAPTWRPGNGHVYGPGDPNNELGTRWMSFKEDILGIHGTLHPETVGEYASNGCVGMHTAEVEELFDLINVGTPLTITGSQDLTRHKFIPPPQVPPPQQLASAAKP
ncbi:L,D-transpeptidase family protein [Candidatus Sumerlaeota bacterium]|nr:L,D-transpeptidase family protein [Candidatus Sumerlaeota bacterium]